jgi:hypothetical protein
LSTDVVERSLTREHLKGEDSDCPDVNKVVIGFAFEDFGADVVKGAAVGCSSFFAVDCPTEIAKFADSLNKRIVTFDMTMFYGFISLCKTSKEWM